MKVTILGAGSYGLALALSFYRNNNEVTVWTKIESEKEEIINTRQNKKALPNVLIPEGISITTDLECVRESEIVILAIPVNFFRSTCSELKEYLNDSTYLCIATKGIENNTNLFCHEIINEVIGYKNISILSGPTFAIDLANNNYSGLTLASNSLESLELIKKALENKTLKIDTTTDIIGTEICGSVKNIMAIISGMLDGMEVVETTKALFLTKALIEIKNLIDNLGGNIKTAYELCGIGDLILTCTSNKSRNFTLGKLIVTNKDKVNNFLENNTVEGYYTLISMHSILIKKNISSPLINFIYEILFENKQKEELLTILTSK